MTEQQFCYWLQGFVELNGTLPTQEQWQMIQEHLKTVFVKITPEKQPSLISLYKDGINPSVGSIRYPTDNVAYC